MNPNPKFWDFHLVRIAIKIQYICDAIKVVRILELRIYLNGFIQEGNWRIFSLNSTMYNTKNVYWPWMSFVWFVVCGFWCMLQHFVFVAETFEKYLTKSFQIGLNLFENIWHLQQQQYNNNNRRENMRISLIGCMKRVWILFYISRNFITFESWGSSTQMQLLLTWLKTCLLFFIYSTN